MAVGSLAEVDRLVASGAGLEQTDWWERTAWLVSLLAGDMDKAKLLRERGANTDARGRCATPPLFYAVEGRHPAVVRWLLEIGQDVDQTDEFGRTPLVEAVELSDLACVDALLAAGADVDHGNDFGTVLGGATTREVAHRLLDAGADPGRLSQEGHRVLCGLPSQPDGLIVVSEEDFRRGATRRFGTANPERMREPFWEEMIRAGISAYEAGALFDPPSPHAKSPIWCAMRFGQTLTVLPDGRVVQIGGEHEDHYDADFCIYNDVFVHDSDGSIALYGYPEAVFPSTDFHTATLLDEAIYVIGSLGYYGTRRYGTTPVYRLDTRTFRMERLETEGEAPGWIYKHRAQRAASGQIRIWGGRVVTREDEEVHADNAGVFVLDVRSRRWTRQGEVGGVT